MNVPVMLTIREAAEILRCTERTIYARRRDGTLRDVRLGGRVLIPAREIARLLEVDRECTESFRDRA